MLHPPMLTLSPSQSFRTFYSQLSVSLLLLGDLPSDASITLCFHHRLGLGQHRLQQAPYRFPRPLECWQTASKFPRHHLASFGAELLQQALPNNEFLPSPVGIDGQPNPFQRSYHLAPPLKLT